MQKFKKEMDVWIKHLNNRVGSLENISSVVNENVIHIQHDYELIYELKDEIEQIKYSIRMIELELKIIRLLQIASNKNATAK